jgi:hypothetical protein
VKWNHFTARKSRKTKILDRDFDSIKIEQGLGLNLALIVPLTKARVRIPPFAGVAK